MNVDLIKFPLISGIQLLEYKLNLPINLLHSNDKIALRIFLFIGESKRN